LKASGDSETNGARIFREASVGLRAMSQANLFYSLLY